MSLVLLKNECRASRGDHVCNNDAKLQADAFEAYADTKTVKACDPASSLCAGPAWFYTPTP